MRCGNATPTSPMIAMNHANTALWSETGQEKTEWGEGMTAAGFVSRGRVSTFDISSPCIKRSADLQHDKENASHAQSGRNKRLCRTQDPQHD